MQMQPHNNEPSGETEPELGLGKVPRFPGTYSIYGDYGDDR